MQTDDMRGNWEINTKKESESLSLTSVKVLPIIIQHKGKTACQFKSPVYGLPSNLWLHLLSAMRSVTSYEGA